VMTLLGGLKAARKSLATEDTAAAVRPQLNYKQEGTEETEIGLVTAFSVTFVSSCSKNVAGKTRSYAFELESSPGKKENTAGHFNSTVALSRPTAGADTLIVPFAGFPSGVRTSQDHSVFPLPAIGRNSFCGPSLR
jgi:hypothetical protein